MQAFHWWDGRMGNPLLTVGDWAAAPSYTALKLGATKNSSWMLQGTVAGCCKASKPHCTNYSTLACPSWPGIQNNKQAAHIGWKRDTKRRKKNFKKKRNYFSDMAIHPSHYIAFQSCFIISNSCAIENTCQHRLVSSVNVEWPLFDTSKWQALWKFTQILWTPLYSLLSNKCNVV